LGVFAGDSAVDRTQRDQCLPFVTKDTSEIRELMAYRNSGCARMSLAEATLLPGRATEAHMHHATEEVYYFLQGTGHIRIAGDEADIQPGDAILIPPGAVHQTWNTGTEPLVFLCVCAPAYEHADTVIVTDEDVT
jgi:mannose-6-phosphate isomerase-like protein (cupin superfamily)